MSPLQKVNIHVGHCFAWLYVQDKTDVDTQTCANVRRSYANPSELYLYCIVKYLAPDDGKPLHCTPNCSNKGTAGFLIQNV